MEMFLGRAFDSSPEAVKRGGMNRFRDAWVTSPAALSLMETAETSLQDPTTILEVLVLNGVPAGVLWATFEADPGEALHAELRLVAFKLSFQRQGLGRICVQRVEELGAQLGAESIRSSGSAPSEGVRRFHESLGFSPIVTVYAKPIAKSVAEA